MVVADEFAEDDDEDEGDDQGLMMEGKREEL